jgi:hypothetical protein
MDRHDVRVVQAGQRAGLSKVGFDVGRLRGQLPMRHFDGHVPLQLIITGQVDQPESALAQDSFDAVAANM